MKSEEIDPFEDTLGTVFSGVNFVQSSDNKPIFEEETVK
jgi:hypothetical protein